MPSWRAVDPGRARCILVLRCQIVCGPGSCFLTHAVIPATGSTYERIGWEAVLTIIVFRSLVRATRFMHLRVRFGRVESNLE
ncbi:hypothetical protein B0T12DRAFT_135016 [Alternaria alternata]|jgi:hypothetical protein|nr:hypothetical protein B0T12DRAFT_135016 [Alternaria alternata]